MSTFVMISWLHLACKNCYCSTRSPCWDDEALNENKHFNSGVKLVTKHALLIIAISAHNSSSRRDIVRVLGVHHRNIVAILSRWKMIDDSGLALWSLSTRKKRTNRMHELLREAVIDSWTSKARVSPKKNDVTRKRFEPMMKNLHTS
jgi:hypothetical protein